MPHTALKFEIVQVPAETFAFVVRRVEADQVGEFVQGAIGRVGQFAAEHGGAQGPPMAIASKPDEYGSMVIEAGWPVAEGTEPSSPVEVGRLPEARAISYRHVGAYDELGSAFYRELFAAVHEGGLIPIAAPRERYLEDHVTEIVWPVA